MTAKSRPTAELGPHGEIYFEGQTFRSPSAFSVHVKRKINPGRKADDGWTSVKYEGEMLSVFRHQLEQLVAQSDFLPPGALHSAVAARIGAGGGSTSAAAMSAGAPYYSSGGDGGGGGRSSPPMRGTHVRPVVKRKVRPRNMVALMAAQSQLLVHHPYHDEGGGYVQGDDEAMHYSDGYYAVDGFEEDEESMQAAPSQQQSEQQPLPSQSGQRPGGGGGGDGGGFAYSDGAVPSQRERRAAALAVANRHGGYAALADGSHVYGAATRSGAGAGDDVESMALQQGGDEDGDDDYLHSVLVAPPVARSTYSLNQSCVLAPPAPPTSAWLRCSAPECRKWRRVGARDLPPSGAVWTCGDARGESARRAGCAAPQELPDEEVAALRADEAGTRYAAASRRPPFEACSAADFEADLARFLSARGEEALAASVREQRTTCNNHPLDLFGLYREVSRRGGLVANERYDDRGRWCGSINFAGDVFPRLRNYTPNNRATSAGNQLLGNYRKFLLAYERANAWRDLPPLAAAAAAAGGAATAAAAGGSNRVVGFAARSHPAASDAVQQLARSSRQTLSAGALQPGLAHVLPSTSGFCRLPSAPGRQPPAALELPTTDALAFLADIAGAGMTSPLASPFKPQTVMAKQAEAAAPLGLAAAVDGAAAAARLSSSVEEAADTGAANDSSAPPQPQVPLSPPSSQQPQPPLQQALACGGTAHTMPAAKRRRLNDFVSQLGPAGSKRLAALHAAASGGGLQAVRRHSTGGAMPSAAPEQAHVPPPPPAAAAFVVGASCVPFSPPPPLPPPGSLLLAQDPLHLSRHWAVVVAAPSDLPLEVAAGGTVSHTAASVGGYEYPLPRASACAGINININSSSSSAGASDALPVLVLGLGPLGAGALGWVEARACRPFTLSAGRSALAGAWGGVKRSDAGAGALDGDPSLLACVSGLKQAYELCAGGGDGGGSSSSSSSSSCSSSDPRSWVQAVATQHTAERLLALEGQLMPPALANGSHGLWAPWRTAVRGAQSPQQLVPQVLLLAHQLLPSALLAAAQGQPPQPAVGGGPFWQELLELLGMSAAAPHTLGATRGCGSSNYGGSSGPSPALAGGPLPTCLSVDEAVSLLAESIDWSQVRRLWLEDVAAANLAAASTAGPAGRFNGGAGAAPRPVGGRAIVTGSAAGQPPLLRAATSGTNLDAMATAAKAQGDLSAAEPGARPDESAAAAAAATSAPAATRTRPAAADAGTDDGGAAGTGLPCRQPTPGPVQLLTSCPADAAVPTGAPTAAAGTGDAGKPPRAPKKSLGPLPTPAQTPPKTALTVSPPVVALELNGGGEPPPPLGAEVAAPGVEAPAALL